MTSVPARRGRLPAAKPLSGIREVAQLAGVSLGTVSNVVNHPERVSVQTRQQVAAAIQRLGFVPNRSATDLRRGQSRMIGLVLPDITNPFFAELAHGAIDCATEHGYGAVMCNTDSDSAKESANLEMIEELQAAGVLLTPVGALPTGLDRLVVRNIRGVLVDRTIDASQGCSVSVDNVAGGEIAISHLIDRGAHQLMLVNGPASFRQCADRRKGARRALRKAGLDASSLTEIVAPAMTVPDGVDAGNRMLATGRLPDAVFCTNDLLAIGVQRAFRQAGVAVPKDVAVVGYDDIDRAGDVPIPLTSIRQPMYQLGHKAAELLLAEITAVAGHQHQRVLFDPVLVPRASTA